MKITAFWFCLLLFASCADPKVDSSDLKDALLQQKLDIYKSSKMQNCRDDALELAVLQVDSAIIDITKRLRQGEIEYMPRPARPSFPAVKESKIEDLNPLFDSLPKPDSFGVQR